MISISIPFIITIFFSGIIAMSVLLKLALRGYEKKEQLNCNHDIFSREVSNGFGRLSTIIYCKKCWMCKKIKH